MFRTGRGQCCGVRQKTLIPLLVVLGVAMSAQALTGFPSAVSRPDARDVAPSDRDSVQTLTDPSRTAIARSWVNVRGGPDVRATSVDSLDPGQATTVICWVTGSTVTGPGGTTDRWDRLGDGRYVSHAFIDGPTDHVPCAGATGPPPGNTRNRIA
jgi:hypothetical protein